MRSSLRRAVGIALLTWGGLAAAQTPPAGSLPTEQMRQFAAAYAMLRESYVDAVDPQALVLAAIRGMLREVDPDGGEFFTAEELRDYTAATSSGQASIGVQMLFRAQAALLGAVTPGGPADRAGLKAGEVIEAIDGKPTLGLRAHQVLGLLRGPEGSTVVLQVRDVGAAQGRRVELQRQSPRAPEVLLQRTAGSTAVLRMPSFQERTLERVADELAREWSRQPFDGLVMDLRGNPGGLLDVAIGVAAIFLPADAAILKTVGRLPEANANWRARPEYYSRTSADPLARLPAALRQVPLVLLVDEGTSAGAEIVVAALKDNRRAAVVGRRTFGRGSIQTLRRLGEGGAVKFTTAVWESPSGARLNGQGVQPDVLLARDTPERELEAAVAEVGRRAAR